MSSVIEEHDVEALSNATLVTLLTRLDAEKRFVSQCRSVLQMKIESLRRSGDTGLTEELDAALIEEQAFSDRRLELQHRISELRIERSRRLTSLRRERSLSVMS